MLYLAAVSSSELPASCFSLTLQSILEPMQPPGEEILLKYFDLRLQSVIVCVLDQTAYLHLEVQNRCMLPADFGQC